MRIMVLIGLLLGSGVGFAEMIQRTARPPNLESPIEAFDGVFTANDQFFERSHLAAIPTIDEAAWRLNIQGDSLEKPMSLTLSDLRSKFKPVEVVALAYCSGNRRGLTEPRVPGVQWAVGAMGNARWKGVRLRDVLAQAGVRKSAVEVVFDGADAPVFPQTPDFKKSIPLVKALHPDTVIAYEMNGQPLPPSQGFPARIIVPGWTATYWIKQLISIEVVSQPFDGFWMKSAYRIPLKKFPEVETPWPGQANDENTPVTEIIVNSLLTFPLEGQEVVRSQSVTVKGLAWDGGHGIRKVEISSDGGQTWKTARLGKDYGRYSWRPFSMSVKFDVQGPAQLLARATNAQGQTQKLSWTPNPAGYHHNVPQPLRLVVR